ncbi:MAG: DNA/RNA nuclease SfsA [Bacilli bacterium]
MINEVVFNYIKRGNLFKNITYIKKGVTYKNPRFDIHVECINDKGKKIQVFVEVKSVTHFDENGARFPDALTIRGTKHLYEVIYALKNGYETYVFFLI